MVGVAVVELVDAVADSSLDLESKQRVSNHDLYESPVTLTSSQETTSFINPISKLH